jgi:putative DNA primase/helicase
LGELGSTFRRADIDALKSFISKDYDSIRPPYAAKVNNYKRRTILYGSVDRLEFLNDAENRRFWVLNVTEVRPFHDIDLQQLWAEVRCFYLDNEKWYLTREEQELLADSNREFEALSPVLEVLTEKIHNPAHCETEPMEKLGTRDLLMRLGLRNVTKAEMNEASAWLQKNRFKRDANTKRYHVVIDEYGTIAANRFDKNNRENVVEFVK